MLSVLTIVATYLVSAVLAQNAYLRYTYFDSVANRLETQTQRTVEWGMDSSHRSVWGWLVHVRTVDDMHHGCTDVVNSPSYTHWVALARRGDCTFSDKIKSVATDTGADAAIIYNDHRGDSVVRMTHDNDNEVAVFMGQSDGERLARLTDAGVCVLVEIAQNIRSLPRRDYNTEPGCRSQEMTSSAATTSTRPTTTTTRTTTTTPTTSTTTSTTTTPTTTRSTTLPTTTTYATASPKRTVEETPKGPPKMGIKDPMAITSSASYGKGELPFLCLVLSFFLQNLL